MHTLPPQIIPGQPPTVLAPMQDITMHSYLHIVAQCGAPDYFFTEYYRVHEFSRIDDEVEKSLRDNHTGRPIIAQIIGEDLVHMRRAAIELAALPIAGIDLNLGCPAPKVFKKNVGGGLLRDPDRIDALLGTLREAVTGHFSVKMRYGFEDDRNFDTILGLLIKHKVDLVSLHARTVRQLYRGKPDYSYITKAVKALPCPVLANGDISSCDKAVQVLEETHAWGVMIGRPAVRNPWIFRQCRERFAGNVVFEPRLRDVRDYVDKLLTCTDGEGLPEKHHVSRMKKLLNFIGLGVDPKGEFLNSMRVTQTRAELLKVCDAFMIDNGRSEQAFSADAHANLVARPNHEGPEPIHASLGQYA
jgi:tRNA-dihydrouridine synthase